MSAPRTPFCLICGSSEDEVAKLHCFPKNIEKCNSWCETLGIRCSSVDLNHNKICRNHFEESEYRTIVTRRLKPDAVPTRWNEGENDRSVNESETDWPVVAGRQLLMFQKKWKMHPNCLQRSRNLFSMIELLNTLYEELDKGNKVLGFTVMVAEAFSYLRMTLDTQKTFLKYFDNGMTPSVARTYHEMHLECQYEGTDFFMYFNAQVNPPLVNYLYNKWRTANFGTREEKSILEVLRQKEELIISTGAKIFIKENPLIIIVLTPIMLRAHRRNFAHDIVFIDSSGSCDQTNMSITFLFAAAKIGAIPLACILHTEQSEANYTLAFSLLREKLGSDGFGDYGFPNVIMTDDSAAERNPLRTVFPEANLLLCIFHVSQAFWRWLWNSHNGISKDHRKIIMAEFQRLLY